MVAGVQQGEGHLIWIGWIEQYETLLSSFHTAVSPCEMCFDGMKKATEEHIIIILIT